MAEVVEEVVYNLKSSDGDDFKISRSAARWSQTLTDMLELLGVAAEDMEPLVVKNINTPSMRLIVEWCEHHKHEEPKLYNPSRPVEIPEWDLEWLRGISNELLFDMMCGANFFNIQLLMDYSCKVVAMMASNKSPQELRVIYQILSDHEEILKFEKMERERREKEERQKKGEKRKDVTEKVEQEKKKVKTEETVKQKEDKEEAPAAKK